MLRSLYQRYPLAFVIFVLWTMLGFVHAIFAPLNHNPDASWYFGTTLRLIRGDYSGSIQGLYSPLISWLLVPLVKYGGLELYRAYCLITAAAAGLVLWGALGIAAACAASPLAAAVTLFTLGLHLNFWLTRLITADLLSAAVMVWWYLLLIHIPKSPRKTRLAVLLGVVLALGYYAKAPELLIGPATLVVLLPVMVRRAHLSLRHAATIGIVSVAVALALSAPWIAVLSQRYGEPIISAQTMLNRMNRTFGYQPGDELQPTWREQTLVAAPATTQPLSDRIIAYLTYQKDRITLSTSLIVFAYGNYYTPMLLLPIIAAIWFWGWRQSALAARASWAWSVVVIGAAVHIAAYLWEWGPYPRYYFAVWPLMYLIFGLGWSTLAQCSVGKHTRLIGIFLGVVGVISVVHTTERMILDLRTRQEHYAPAIRRVAALIANDNGDPTEQLTGRIHDRVAQGAAALLKREYWSVINPETETDSQQLRLKLVHRNIGYVVWTEEMPESLRNVTGLRLVGEINQSGVGYSVWHFEPVG